MPEFILLQTLSFTTDIKLAVQTCVLSKRWRDHLYNISTIRLSSGGYPIPLTLFENCVNYAIAHNVQQLHLSPYLAARKSFQFPPRFFTCQSLTLLKLPYTQSCFLIPKPFSLTHLKTLYLDSFTFGDENNSFGPFLGFPKLESLTLRNCQVANLIINAPMLRLLDIILYERFPIISFEANIVISTPRLAVFKFEGQISLDCSICELPCLETLYVDLWTLFVEPNTDQVKKVMPLNLFRMLRQLKNAKLVTLSMDTIEVLAMDQEALESQPLPFCNLEHLKFVTRTHVFRRKHSTTANLPCNVMAYLTQGSPHRDIIVVELPKESMENNDDV